MLLKLKEITKTYPGVIANDAVSLELNSGQILALLGENGAGKSTLMKILAGLTQPDQGTIEIQGVDVVIRSPNQSRQLGIGMVQQHFALFDGLSVLDNIALGLPKIARSELRERAMQLATTYGFQLDLDDAVFSLSAGEKQRIEIVRTLLSEPKILILDEPTSVLTPQEADQLFDAIRRLADRGHGIIFISHKLDEVARLCDSAVILRRGRVAGTCDPRGGAQSEMAAMMLGSQLPDRTQRGTRTLGPPQLVIHDAQSTQGDAAIKSLTLHAGEILGIAGVAGNGQDALFALLSGESSMTQERALKWLDQPVGGLDPNARRSQLGWAFVPEERLGHGAVPHLSLTENALLTNLADPTFASNRLIHWSHVTQTAESIATQFDVRHAGLHRQARSLSGGNLQKFVVGRELIKNPTLLIINQPTWGVDMGAARHIRDAINTLAESGGSVIVISQDLDELFELCDTLCVINHGTLSPPRLIDDWTLVELGLAMGGQITETIS